jgi:excisionase family DNA binding protein
MTDGREYLRARDIAEITGVTIRTVRRWIADEVVPSTRLGGARLVAKTDLQRLLSPTSETTDEAEEGDDEQA